MAGAEVHQGVEFTVPTYTEVLAMQAGVVDSVVDEPNYRHGIILSHEGGKYFSQYSHLMWTVVSPGEAVTKGQTIGVSNNCPDYIDVGFHVYQSGRRVSLYPFWYPLASISPYPDSREFDLIQTPYNYYYYSRQIGSYTDVNIYPRARVADR